jgi:SagB-type dehydrogenase family enzyme
VANGVDAAEPTDSEARSRSDSTAFASRGAPRLWPGLVTVRPATDDRSPAVMVSDAQSARRLAVDWATLFDLVAAEAEGEPLSESHRRLSESLSRVSVGDPGRPTASRLAAMRHWWRRRWHPSLEYYLWSRRSNASDFESREGDNGGRRARPAPERPIPPGPRLALSPAPPLPDRRSFGALLFARRTARSYSARPAPSATFSGVLRWGLPDACRTPPALGLHPSRSSEAILSCLRVYAAVYSVDGIAPGAYFYDGDANALVPTGRLGDCREAMRHLLFGSEAPLTANWTLILVADFARLQFYRPDERALRDLYVEAGALGQRLLLVAAACGLAALPTPACRDREMEGFLSLDARRYGPVYTVTMGSSSELRTGREASPSLRPPSRRGTK